MTQKEIEPRSHEDTKNRAIFRIALRAFVASWFMLVSIAHAAPKLEEVFKSTQENFDEQSSGGKFFAWICAVIGLLILLAILHRRWERRSVKPKVLNNQAKLIKQLQKQVNLRKSEVRQLKSLADEQSVQNPLALLLCPSVLVKAARANPSKVDRGLISSMVKRLG